MVTVGIVCLMGLMGLVVDLGWGYYQKQVAQAAADSAVMGRDCTGRQRWNHHL